MQQLVNNVNNSSEKKQKANGITFVPEGQPVVKIARKPTGILHEAKDWKLEVDLEKKLNFPDDIIKSNLRPRYYHQIIK